MGHDGVASGYPTPTCFHRLTGCQRDPQDKGVTATIPHNDGLVGLQINTLGGSPRRSASTKEPQIRHFNQKRTVRRGIEHIQT